MVACRIRKTARALLLGAALALGGLGLPGPTAPALAQTGGVADGASEAGAQSIPRPVVGVIDLQRVLREADAAQAVRDKREEFVAAYQADAARVEQELRAADQDLARLRASAEPEDFAAKRSAFQQRVAESQRNVQQRRRNLERAFGKAMSEVQQATIRIADEIAAEKGVNVILYRSQVFLFDNAMDLTDEILERLDSRMPTVAFPDPESMSEEPASTPALPDVTTGD